VVPVAAIKYFKFLTRPYLYQKFREQLYLRKIPRKLLEDEVDEKGSISLSRGSSRTNFKDLKNSREDSPLLERTKIC
jgi:hypothetical protein